MKLEIQRELFNLQHHLFLTLTLPKQKYIPLFLFCVHIKQFQSWKVAVAWKNIFIPLNHSICPHIHLSCREKEGGRVILSIVFESAYVAVGWIIFSNILNTSSLLGWGSATCWMFCFSFGENVVKWLNLNIVVFAVRLKIEAFCTWWRRMVIRNFKST